MSCVLQVQVDLHKEQKNLCMVLAHSRASAVSEKHPWSLGEAKVRLDRAQF